MTTPTTDLPVTSPVPPGLAVRPEPDDGTGLARFTIYHAATGHRLCGPSGDRCVTHLNQALVIIADAGIDWTQDNPVPTARDRCIELNSRLRDELGLCFDPEPWIAKSKRCLGDQPDALVGQA